MRRVFIGNIKGPAGFSPTVEVANNTDSEYALEITSKDGKIVTPNLKGEKGDAGADGKDGITPDIGANGNWFIGDTDTGVSAYGYDQGVKNSASKWEFAQCGSTIRIEPSAGSAMCVTSSVNTTVTHNGNIYTLTAGTPTEIIAMSGTNILTATTGSILVEYNRNSMSVLNDLTIPITNTASIAQIDGVIGDLPLDITARIAQIDGVNSIQVTRCGKNLFNGVICELALSGSHITSSAVYRGTYILCVPNTTYTISRANLTNRFRAVFTSTLPKSGVVGFGGTGGSSSKYDSSYTMTVTAPEDAKYLFVYLSNQGDEVENLQIELGSIATNYEPGRGGTFSVALPETIYGTAENSAEVHIQTIPSLPGINTVLTDAGGETTVTGRQGLQGAIQNLTNAALTLTGGNI